MIIFWYSLWIRTPSFSTGCFHSVTIFHFLFLWLFLCSSPWLMTAIPLYWLNLLHFRWSRNSLSFNPIGSFNIFSNQTALNTHSVKFQLAKKFYKLLSSLLTGMAPVILCLVPCFVDIFSIDCQHLRVLIVIECYLISKGK